MLARKPVKRLRGIMAGEAVFKSQKPAKASVSVETKKEPVDTKVGESSNIEPLYLDYERENGQPFVVDYFDLGRHWADQSGGFPKEVAEIENYFREMIESGEMANSSKTVKDRLKEILKVTGMSKEERNVVKMETVAEYVKFLRKTSDIKHSITRYGRS